MQRCILTFLLFVLLLPGTGNASQTTPRILAGTSIVADILSDLTGPEAKVQQLIPGGACPGHYDLRPGDLIFLEKADLLVLEGYQPNMSNMTDLIQAADNRKLQTLVLPKIYNSMLPSAQITYTERLATELAKLFPAMASSVDKAAAKRIDMIRTKASREAARLRPAKDVPTLCAAMQKGFASWAGLKVVGTYGRPEDLSPSAYGKLLTLGKDNHVRLVLDNLQSGPNAGAGIAESLQAGHADLTSFPGALPGQDGWAAAFTANTQKLLDALAEAGK